jgi:magnesium-transporting ATPase (P-type)
MYRFNGKLSFSDTQIEPVTVGLKQFIYKGSLVKNSDKIYAMVAYTGVDTKLVLNSGAYHFKLSRMEGIINTCILFNIGLAFMINGIMLIENHFWLKKNLDMIAQYVYPDGPVDYPENTSFLTFTNFLLLNNFIPLAMVVTQELFKILYTPMMECDAEMVNKEGTRHVEVHNMMLHEELGQINYMFCDKTGTLTQNNLIFEGVSINGKAMEKKLGDMKT